MEIIAIGMARLLYRSDKYAETIVTAKKPPLLDGEAPIDRTHTKECNCEWSNAKKLCLCWAETQLADDRSQEVCKTVDHRSKHKIHDKHQENMGRCD